MHIDNLIVEITRKCNMSCDHCLRGDTQNVNIDSHLFKHFIKLNRIDSIGCLSITGGEPMLNPNAIIRIAHVIYEQDVNLFGFFMATNGTMFDYSLIKPLAIFREKVDEDDMFFLEISKDDFHDNKPIHPIWKLIKHGIKKIEEKYVIAEGRGRDINPEGRTIQDGKWVWEDGDIREGDVYINALGMVCKECNFSYESQKDYNIGHCLNKKLIEMEDNDYENETED